MDKCINLYYNGKEDYFVCATDDEIHLLDERFKKLDIHPMDTLKHRMNKFLKHHQGGNKKEEDEEETESEEEEDEETESEEEEDEETESEEKEVKDQDTGINFEINLNELPQCSLTGPTGPNDYIVSFGFEYENGSFYLLNTGSDGNWRNYLLSDGRYNQNVKVKTQEGIEDINNHHLLQITSDSALDNRLVLNQVIYNNEKPFSDSKYNLENCQFKFSPTGTIDTIRVNCNNNLDINIRDMMRKGEYKGFDYLELIYTVFNMNKKINLNCFIKYDDDIRKIIQRYINQNYEVCNRKFKAILDCGTQNECQDKDEKKITCQKLNKQIIDKGETYYFYKPKSGNLPWMFCNMRNRKVKGKDDPLTCPNMDNLTWGVQATVGVNYNNIISFMEELFDFYSKNNEKKELKTAKETVEQIYGKMPTDEFRNKPYLNFKNWLTLKLFYLNMDKRAFSKINDFRGKYPPLDAEYVQPNLTKNIDELYNDWIEDKINVIYTNEEDEAEGTNTRLEYIKAGEAKTQDEIILKKPAYTDIRTLYNNKYKVNKDTTYFCIRHSLYQVLYELCGKNVDTCLKFLKDIKPKLTNDYYIKDFNKGIAYFHLLKDKKEEIETPETFKDFQNFNDPDLSIEINYGKVEPHTKYRIKYYNFSKDDKKDEEGQITLVKYSLLFEIRNYGFVKTAIERERQERERQERERQERERQERERQERERQEITRKRAREEDQPVDPSVKKQRLDEIEELQNRKKLYENSIKNIKEKEIPKATTEEKQKKLLGNIEKFQSYIKNIDEKIRQLQNQN
jgi:hypothetical protein